MSRMVMMTGMTMRDSMMMMMKRRRKMSGLMMTMKITVMMMERKVDALVMLLLLLPLLLLPTTHPTPHFTSALAAGNHHLFEKDFDLFLGRVGKGSLAGDLPGAAKDFAKTGNIDSECNGGCGGDDGGVSGDGGDGDGDGDDGGGSVDNASGSDSSLRQVGLMTALAGTPDF